MAVLALGYGLLHAVTLVVFAAYQGFPFERYYMGGGESALAMSVMLVLSAALLIAGGWGLFRWKSWGRIVLIVWSVLEILLDLARMIVATAFWVREYAGTTQPAVQPQIGLVVWNSFHYWLTSGTLSIVLLVTLLQPEVAKLWAGPGGSGGFEVIPMAGTAPTEVVR